MSDIEADNNNNISLQREHPEEETESIPNKAEADDATGTVPELDLEALHGSLAHPNPNDKLKGAKLKWLKTEISDEIEIDAALKKWQSVSGPAQADVKTQSKREKCSVLDQKNQEEVKTKSGDDVAPPSTAPEGDSIWVIHNILSLDQIICCRRYHNAFQRELYFDNCVTSMMKLKEEVEIFVRSNVMRLCPIKREC